MMKTLKKYNMYMLNLIFDLDQKKKLIIEGN